MRKPFPDASPRVRLAVLAATALFAAAGVGPTRAKNVAADMPMPSAQSPSLDTARGIPGRAPVKLTDQQEQLINIRTVPVERLPLTKTIRTVGRVVANEARTATLNSRVMGWVEKLDVDTTGATVAKGQPLLQIYSPALYSAQQDFLIIAHRRKAEGSDDGLFESARQRLVLWGISDEQIRQLERTGKPSYTLTLTAPLGGTVIEKPVVDAQMVKPGMPLYRIADLSTVWVLADLYESDLPYVTTGQDAVVSVPAYSDSELHGRVDFIYPFLQAKTRTDQARLVFANPDGLLKPDMYVNVRIERALGTPLSVPASAIFNTGDRQYVFVERQPGLFVPVIVELGPLSGSRQAIVRGVKAGERVVVSGNFMLDSESQLRAAASVASDENSMPDTSSQSTTAVATGKTATAAAPHPLPAAAAKPAAALMRAYAQLHEDLFHDSTSIVAPAVKVMKAAAMALGQPDVAPEGDIAGYTRMLTALDRELTAPTGADLTAARRQFGAISAALIDLLKAYPPPLSQPLHILHCPMWTKSPADWLQTAADTQNPFLGTKMATCGSVVGTIGKGR